MRSLPIALFLLLISLPAFATKNAPKISETKSPESVQTGVASWYGGRWIGHKTASGEIYRRGDVTAAHRTLPFNSRVRVTDERTGRAIVVRINNRGPFVKGRVIDLSEAAARELGITGRGIAKVRVEVVDSETADSPVMAKQDRKPSRFSTWFAPIVAAN